MQYTACHGATWQELGEMARKVYVHLGDGIAEYNVRITCMRMRYEYVFISPGHEGGYRVEFPSAGFDKTYATWGNAWRAVTRLCLKHDMSIERID